jgi:hypothetical protein
MNEQKKSRKLLRTALAGFILVGASAVYGAVKAVGFIRHGKNKSSEVNVNG